MVRKMEKLAPGLSILLFLLILEALSRARLIDPFVFPAISSVLTMMMELAISGELIEHIMASLIRVFAGVTLSLLLGVSCGIMLGRYRWSRLTLEGILELLRPLPAVALIQISILLFGIGHTSKIFLIAFGCFFPIFFSVMHGVQHIEKTYILAAMNMGASESQILSTVIMKAILPNIFTGIRISFAISLIILVASEMVGATSGLGWLIIVSNNTYQITKMYAGILTLVLIGLSLNLALLWTMRLVLKWEKEVYLQ